MPDDVPQLITKLREVTAPLAACAAFAPRPALAATADFAQLPRAVAEAARAARLLASMQSFVPAKGDLTAALGYATHAADGYAYLAGANATGDVDKQKSHTSLNLLVENASHLYATVARWRLLEIVEGWELAGLEAQAKKQVADCGELLKRQNQAFAKWTEDIKADRQLTEKARDDTAAARDSARQAVAVVGTTKHAGLFAAEAKLHRTRATRWLLVVIAMALVTLGTAAAFLIAILRGDLDFNTLSVSSVVVAKVALFVGLYFILVWATRNYRAHRHNAVVNAHRHNALVTFETFVAATDAQDQQVRHAILLRATDCIFAHVSTGYSSGSGEQRSAIEVVEAASRVLGKGA